MLHRFAIAELPSMPWKNGGGSTREIVCQPTGAGMEAFDWRVSIATIARSGPFSVFAGIDRSILLLDGDGVQLRAPGQFDHRLDTPGQAFAFSGDVTVDCTLLGGESTDLNVMARRAAVVAEAQMHCRPVALTASPAGVVLALDREWTLQTEGTALEVSAGQGVWWADCATAWHCSTSSPLARLLTVRITPIAR